MTERETTAATSDTVAGDAAPRDAPGSGATVSGALIVHNEAAALGRCLESVRGAVDEIVVADTGSDDNTVAIARRSTDRVFDVP